MMCVEESGQYWISQNVTWTFPFVFRNIVIYKILCHDNFAANCLQFCFLFYFSSHWSKHLWRKQQAQPNHQAHNYHVQTREGPATLYFLLGVSLYMSFIQTRTMRVRRGFVPSVMCVDPCAGEEKTGFSSKCGFSSPCHLKAFQLTFHIILNLIINSPGKRTSDDSWSITNF